jgi:hypothetical protein
MTNDLYAIRGEFTGISTPVWLRLYRHRDTTHLNYMSADGKTYTRKGAEADKAFNYPMDPPTSGKDGRYFWIRQQMPPEKTFPQGFEYVLMGVVSRRATSTSRPWKARPGWALRLRTNGLPRRPAPPPP